MKRAVTAAALGLYVTIITGCAAPPPPPGAAYGSREEQCHEWAKQQTGWDTAKGAGVGAAVGALAGAATGAAIGAATGNAGRGAAIGAASGALVGTGVGAAYKYSQSESGYRQAYVDCVAGRAR
jgi:Glycine-zipper domain